MNTLLGLFLGCTVIRAGAEVVTAAANAVGHAVSGDFKKASEIAVGIPALPVTTAVSATATAVATLMSAVHAAHAACSRNELPTPE